MLSRRCGIIFCFTLVAISGGSVSADSDLLNYLPGDSTNFVAVLNVRNLQDTLANSDRVANAASLPKWLDRLVIGSQVRIGYGERVNSYYLADHPQGISLTFVAKQREGMPDKIGSHSAFLCAPGDYLVEIGPRQFGLVRPGVRQEVASWIDRVDRNQQVPLSESLRTEISREGDLIIALDLSDSVAEGKAKSWLESHDVFAGQKSKVARIAKLAASANIASAVITLANEPRIEFRVVFSSDINIDAVDLAQAIRQAVADRGVSLPELDAAEPEIDGNALLLRSPIGSESIRKVLSLVLTPHTMAAVAPDASERAQSSTKEISRQYLGSVNQIIYDLEKANRRASDYLRTAAWHDNFANQIEELPIAGVPSPFIEYGNATANRLRALAASLRGQAVSVDADARSVTYDVQSHPGYIGVGLWGGWAVQPGNIQVTSNAAEIRRSLAATVAAGTQEREQIWLMQAEDRQRAMQTFETEFGEKP